MKWYHECSLDWMRARQKCLTASDIKDLLPFTASGRSRKITDDDYIKVLARKTKQLSIDDCISTGAAARGHLLEPYAIDFYNDHVQGVKLYHWDDVVIRNLSDSYDLGFSPDACNIPMPDGIDDGCISYGPDEIAEIKCYSAEKHLIKGGTDKKDLEERWQVATAMAAVDSIMKARVIFFNPSMQQTMFFATYARKELEEEIRIVNKICDDWEDFLTRSASYALSMITGLPFEESIKREIEEEQSVSRFDPLIGKD